MGRDCPIGPEGVPRKLLGMKVKPLDPRRLDVAELAQRAEQISGQWPLALLERLSDFAVAESPATASAQVSWQLTGQARPITGGAAEIWLHMQAQISLPLCCQRCLGPVQTRVEVDTWLRFVGDEAQAAALDAELEEDVLALEREQDALELVEDELLLALPLVPRHDECPQPLPMPADDLDDEADEADALAKPNPFAALAQLKKKPS
jgi:uncharacterized protein